METALFLITGILTWAVIYQSIEIKRLRKQTIEAFSRICLKIFNVTSDDQ